MECESPGDDGRAEAGLRTIDDYAGNGPLAVYTEPPATNPPANPPADPFLTADTHIQFADAQFADAERMLLLGAVLEGSCGNPVPPMEPVPVPQ